MPGQLAQRPDPLPQLLVGVQVVEAFRRATAALVPRVCVASVETHVGRRRRECEDGRRDILRALDARRVDDHVRGAQLLEEAQRLVAMLVVEPARVPELDEHLVATELLARPLQIVQRAVLEHDVRGELEQDPAELAGGAQRLERLEKATEDLAAKLPRRPLDAALVVRRRVVAQVGRERFELDGMARHQAERLHVHHESVRRPRCPALHHLLRRQAVVGRIDLDRVEVLCVVRQPLAGRQSLRIPVLRERLVGPGARPDPHFSHVASILGSGPLRGQTPAARLRG